MSRPEKPIDWKKVDELLVAGCFGTEIASHFDMHHETFYTRVQEKFGVGFTAYASEKKSQGDSILRAVQYKHALKGNTTMLIWLGKNRLKQREGEDPKEKPPNDASIDETLLLAKENQALKEKNRVLEEQLHASQSQASSNPL